MQRANQRVVIEQDGDDIRITTPYNFNFLEELKTEIPSNLRKWDASEKQWVIDADFSTEVEELIGYYYPDVEVEMY